MKPPLASMAEAQAFLDDIRAHSAEWFQLAAFLLMTGARRGEAAGLRFQDISLDRSRGDHSTVLRHGTEERQGTNGSHGCCALSDPR